MRKPTLDRLASSAGFACLTMILLLGPPLLSWGVHQGGASESPDVRQGPRRVVGAELLEAKFSEGLRDVMHDLAGLEEPTWESLRRILEDRGRVGAEYSFKVRWLMNDGGSDEVGYVRRPYENTFIFPELLEIARRSRSGSRAEEGSIPWDFVLDMLAEALDGAGG